jgi:hypothetical protein
MEKPVILASEKQKTFQKAPRKASGHFSYVVKLFVYTPEAARSECCWYLYLWNRKAGLLKKSTRLVKLPGRTERSTSAMGRRRQQWKEA